MSSWQQLLGLQQPLLPTHKILLPSSLDSPYHPSSLPYPPTTFSTEAARGVGACQGAAPEGSPSGEEAFHPGTPGAREEGIQEACPSEAGSPFPCLVGAAHAAGSPAPRLGRPLFGLGGWLGG